MKYNTIIYSSRRNLGGTRHLGKLAILRKTLRKASFSRFPRKYQVCDIATLISNITMLGAICQSERSTDRRSRCAIGRSTVRATIDRSRNEHVFARSTDRAGMVLRDRPIVQEWFCVIDRSCRNMVLRDRPIVQEWFCVIDRSCRNRSERFGYYVTRRIT